MLVFQPTINNDINMFAHLRSKKADPAKQELFNHLATTMRDAVRSQIHTLFKIDQHNNPEFAGPLAEIYLREFACTLKTLNQVNRIATLYHEDAFDNTDAYIDQPQQPHPEIHEMTAEQRHSSQILLGVGNNYSEINVALRMLECGISMRDVMECKDTAIETVARKFQKDSSTPEDAFDRLHHITKKVWSMVNMLAFSNLFRFADPAQPILIPNPEDSIFIPYIPTATNVEEAVQIQTPTIKPDAKFDPSRYVCNECDKKFDPMDMHHLIISPETNATEFYLCHLCGFKRDFPDEYREFIRSRTNEPAPAHVSDSESDNDDEANAP